MFILILDIYCICGMYDMYNTWNLVSILCINIKYSYQQNTWMETYVSSEMWRTICPESRVKLVAVPNVDNAVIYHESLIGNLLKTISILLCEKKRK